MQLGQQNLNISNQPRQPRQPRQPSQPRRLPQPVRFKDTEIFRYAFCLHFQFERTFIVGQ